MNEKPKLTREQRLAWKALFETHARVLQKIDEDLEEAGVGSLTDYDVLYALYLSPDHRVRLAELATAALLSRSGLTRLVHRLEEKGFLRREPCEEDRRGAFAHLTEEGIEELRRIWKVYSAGIATYFFPTVTPEETEVLERIFGRVRGTLRSDAAL